MSPNPAIPSLAILQSIFDGVPDAMIVVDGAGRIALANPAAALLFGYEHGELAGRPVDGLVPSDLRRLHVSQREAFHRTPDRRKMGAGRQLKACRKDGSLVPVDISLSSVDLVEGTFVVAIARDVSVYHRFLEACPIAILVAESGRVTYANPAAHRLAGIRDDGPFHPTEVVDLVHPDEREAMRTRFAAANEAEHLPLLVTGRVVGVDGAVRWVESTGVVVPNTAKPTMLIAMQDVTERRAASERARALEAMLHEQQRLADIGAVTARVAHDVGNPVAGLVMSAERALQLLDRAPGDVRGGPLRPPVERLLATSRHLNTLLQEFKDFSRVQRLDLCELWVGPFLDEVREAWAAEAASRKVTLRVDCAREIDLRGDPLKLRRVFDNLVKNALEAIGDGPGEVRLHVGTGPDGWLAIDVADSGPGVPKGMDPFALFETTKPDGTGLGLPSVRQVVEAHGGTIVLVPASGVGAVFRISLPRAVPAR